MYLVYMAVMGVSSCIAIAVFFLKGTFLERLIWNETHLLQNETKSRIWKKTPCQLKILKIKTKTNLKFRLFVMWCRFYAFDADVWAVWSVFIENK